LEYVSANNQINNNQTQDNHTQSIDRDARKTSSYKLLKKTQQKRKILEDVLKSDVPINYKRKNILIGNNLLYGIITKKAQVFNEIIEEKEWELIPSFSRKTIDLEGHKLRIHFNIDLNQIQAIEILEEMSSLKNSKEHTEEINLKSWTVKKLRQFCQHNNIKIPSSYRKADIIRLVMESNNYLNR
jgi:hypothetical protein